MSNQEDNELEVFCRDDTDPPTAHGSKLRRSSFIPYAKWALFPVLMAVPVASELINSYARKVLAFSDPSDWPLVCIEIMLLGVIGVYVIRRIIEREKIFSALALNESRYRNLFENSIDSITITAPNGELLEANEAFFNLFGYSRDELKNFNVLQLYVNAVDRSRFREEVERCGSVRDFEVKRRKKDGTEIVCELSAALRRDDTGRIIGYQTILRDITARKQAEQALRTLHAELEQRVRERTKDLSTANETLRQEIADRQRAEAELRHSEERFRAVFESAQDCIFMKDQDLRYTHVNPAMLRLLAIPPEKIVGNADDALFDADTSRSLRDVERRVLQGRTIEIQQSVPGAGGQLILSCIRSPLLDPAGSIMGVYGIARDLTDRQAQEAELMNPPGSYGSTSMKAVLDQIALASTTDSIVLLLGESGTGKDYLARHLHDKSHRSAGPFFAINCAALPGELAESELFGHEAGAFTGSRARKRGLLELAEGGTLLLNEIGDLPISLQAKLLSFLDTQSFTRIGGEKSVEVNTRVIAATNRDLERDVAEGNFREDLFYRLNVFTILVPPLRQRKEDLPLLVTELLNVLAKRMGFSEAPGVDRSVMDILAEYQWPGNVRELRNVLERSLILCNKKRVTLKDVGKLRKNGDGSSNQIGLSCSVSISVSRSLPHALREAERSLAFEALRRSGGSIKTAALELGISRDQMKYLMKSLGIQRNNYPQIETLGVNITHA
jgi:sigma-54 dependent transcriptional regulator, acetoin dehydrogenase operon transcriptional activator AcoR